MCYLPNMDLFLQIIDIQSFTLYLHVQINFNKDTQNNMTYGNQQSIWQVCTEIHLDGFSSKKNFSQGKCEASTQNAFINPYVTAILLLFN